MNMYDPNLRVAEVEKLPKEQHAKIDGIPEGLERFETVKLVTRTPRLMYRACVVDISTEDNCYWVTFDRHQSLWT